MHLFLSVRNVSILLLHTGKTRLQKSLKRSLSPSILRKNAHDMVSPMPNFSRIFCPTTKTPMKNRLSTRKSHVPCQKNKTFLTFRTPHLGSVTRIRSYSNWSSSPNLASKSIQNPEQHINSSIVEFKGLIVEFDLKLIRYVTHFRKNYSFYESWSAASIQGRKLLIISFSHVSIIWIVVARCM